MNVMAEVAAEVAEALRGVLAELADPGSELTASAATRHRIEGATAGLDQVVAMASTNLRS